MTSPHESLCFRHPQLISHSTTVLWRSTVHVYSSLPYVCQYSAAWPTIQLPTLLSSNRPMIHIRAKPTASVQSMKEDLCRKVFGFAPLTPICEVRDMGDV